MSNHEFYAVYAAATDMEPSMVHTFSCQRNAEKLAKKLAEDNPGKEIFVYVPLKSYSTHADIKERRYV